MKKYNGIFCNTLISTSILSLFLGVSLFVQNILKTTSPISALFILAVILISLLTQGYIYGIISSLISVLIINFAFTYPYYKFNFSIVENLVSAIVMLIITVVSCTVGTKLKEQERLRVESVKENMRANLLRAISHDLRTPLTTIYGSSATIMNQYDSLSKEQVFKLASGIKEDAEWLKAMVENLLIVTKINNEGIKINKIPIVLEELIDSVIVRFKKRYPNQPIGLDIPEEFVSIPMDPVLIEQVIVNILENAVCHAKGMTELKLSVHILSDVVQFEISDNGCGISKDRLHNIFSDYYEYKNVPIDNKKNNMGIGLSVCTSIIKAHGGNISAENKKTGGCIFRFTLKMEDKNNE